MILNKPKDEDMNCKNMFIIVVLLNKVVATLVENMMAMD
jgi:hypothetical protein